MPAAHRHERNTNPILPRICPGILEANEKRTRVGTSQVRFISTVPERGLEPPHPCGYWILRTLATDWGCPPLGLDSRFNVLLRQYLCDERHCSRIVYAIDLYSQCCPGFAPECSVRSSARLCPALETFPVPSEPTTKLADTSRTETELPGHFTGRRPQHQCLCNPALTP